MMNKKSYNLNKLQKKIGYTFTNVELLEEALTHSSYNDKSNINQERLEFLGDRVLGLVISEYLFNNFNKEREGFLTNKYRYLVQNKKCTEVAKNIKILNFLKLGNSEKKKKETLSDSILANSIEAMLGAIFLDSDYQSVRKIILNLWKEFLVDQKILKADISPKNILQELLHANKKSEAEYKLISKEGEDHNPNFIVEVIVSNLGKTNGEGSSIKDAEMDAAERFLKEFQIG
ncbi:MAG: ribonuclease III [Pseudomonadota bacterium]|nr:ribonuclease III [Pseudomonadota bacterium]MEC7830181.1 ribonuclease III [Pseudomonadota bacterium]MEC9382698.1 ribonuclease III [Pseudomonadota bacterium]